jgi:hypothetical protein
MRVSQDSGTTIPAAGVMARTPGGNGPAERIVLRNSELAVVLLPGKGCDIYCLTDLATGVDVLAKTRLTPADVARMPYARTSADAWLAQYLGGWQLILPNGGAPSEVRGTEWGFHGEACLLPWSVEATSGTSAVATVRLLHAPLHVRRIFELAGRTLRLTETVRNESSLAVEVMWAHHPAFGAPFLDENCVVATGARRFSADDEAPGTELQPGSVHDWPRAVSAAGAAVRLDRVSPSGSGAAHLGYLSDFRAGFFAISNPVLKLGVAVRWPLETFPQAWYWAEAGAAQDFPWFGDFYTLAIEPSTSAPAQGIATLRGKGGQPLVLPGGEERTVELETTLFLAGPEVINVGPAGDVRFASAAGEGI